MVTLRTLTLLAVTASLTLASAGAQTVSKVTVFDSVLTWTRLDAVWGAPFQFSSGFPMEVAFEGFAENLYPTATNFVVELYADTPDSLLRHVFPLPPANDTGEHVVVPISFTYSFPTTVDGVSARIFDEGPAEQIHYWGKLTQTGTILDAPVIKLPNLVVEHGTTQVTGVVTVSGGVHQIAGLEFPLQVGNGGPENVPPGDSIVPIGISSMETQFPGSVFSSMDVFQLHPNAAARTGLSEVFPGEFQIAHSQTLINWDEPYASINGTDLPLLQFTLSLHDAPPGIYPLIASNTLFRKASLLDDSRDNAIVDSVHIMDGSIIILPRPEAIVPEPNTVVLAGMAALCMTALYRAPGRRRLFCRR
jgi:hypothetical protein